MATKQCMIDGIVLIDGDVTDEEMLYGQFAEHLAKRHEGMTVAEYQEMERRQPRHDPYEHRPSGRVDARRRRL